MASAIRIVSTRARLAPPVENVWGYLRKNQRAVSVFKDCGRIAGKSSEAWNFSAGGTAANALMPSRSWSQVSPKGGR
jgi:hypothetical protein